MSTVDELLDSMDANPEVYADEEYITVNPSDRSLTIPESQTIFGVYMDKDVERKRFRCPKVVGDNVDITDCYVFVNYVSTGGKPGKYLCEDVVADDDYITFSWVLSNRVFDGNKDTSIRFAVQVQKATQDGDLQNVFNTRPATGISYSTVESTEGVADEYADVILSVLARLEHVGDIDERFTQLEQDVGELNASIDEMNATLDTLVNGGGA